MQKGKRQHMSTSADEADERERTLPDVITIPDIRGEMCRLRPATWADCQRMDDIHAFDDAETITGKSSRAERAVVRAWVSRSVAWSGGVGNAADASSMPGWSDPESRGVMAWSMYTDAQHTDSHDSHDSAEPGAESDSTLIGMIFLVDIDWWNKSARLQVVLGVDYRGRGYSRDAMPRVMTFAFARRPVGLGLERIWLSLPDANTRNSSVYESLGFDLTGHSRNAMWDSRDGEYHDVLIYDEIAEEYDPIRSLAAFGLHNIIDNPGVKEALAARNEANENDAADSEASDGSASSETAAPASHADSSAPSDSADVESAVSQGDGSASAHADSAAHTSTTDEESPKKSSDDALDDALSELSGEYGGSSSVHTDWAYGDDAIRQPGKKRAWWRNLGRNRNRKGDES